MLAILLLLIAAVSEAWQPVSVSARRSMLSSRLIPVLTSHPSLISPRPMSATLLDEVDVDSGPQLNAKKRALIEQFVDRLDGKRVIQRILIANNGMAATKSILSMRQWAYMTLGDERALEFVVMATRDDLNANAEFIRLADTFVEVPSGSNKNNYANVDLIVDIAVKQKVDAVWPGWGHASENPRLPSFLKAKGIQFIGPTASVMAALGDKVSANILAQTAKVPSIPWSGDGLESGLNADGVIPPDVFQQACVTTAEEAMKMAEKIGYPVMIKASEGGGGKGIRMVQDAKDLRINFQQVQNEVPGSPIFMMQLCSQARHLEVQIVGDEYGNAVALNGRDCSTQRRFQKIFEEGPPIVAPRTTFRAMELAAQRLTQSIGYIGAGTVEYLYNAEKDQFFFLELNPRLQVEHPVTEGLTNINLPAVQLQVAMGIALNRIAEIRSFYGLDPQAKEPIDFNEAAYVYPQHHVIAARITAENPDEGFKPTSGRIERVKFQSTPRVWGYFSVGANGGIHEFADSQFGHLFASGPSREEARKALVLALKELDVRGDIRTTVEYLIKLLETEEFKANRIDTSWLDGIIREKAVALNLDPQLVALSAAIYSAHSAYLTQAKELAEALTKGQSSLQSVPGLLTFPVDITYDNVAYKFTVKVLGPNFFALMVNGQRVEVRVRQQPDQSLLCSVLGAAEATFQLYGQREALGLRMKINGQTVLLPTVFNPSELRSDVTGKLVRYLQQDRDFVDKDTPFVEVEAMKMIMSLKAQEAGTIRHILSPGSILSAGDLIATLTLQDPSKVRQINKFNGQLACVPVGPPSLQTSEAAERLSLAMDGFESDFDEALTVFFQTADASTILSFLHAEVQKFVQREQVFQQDEEAATVLSLVKAAKEEVASVVLPQLIARKQLRKRCNLMLALLRELEFLPEKLPGWTLSKKSLGDEMVAALKAVGSLTGAAYGPVALKAQQIVDVVRMPPFQQRLDALKHSLEEAASAADLAALAKQPNIAVSVDLLVVLMGDAKPSVRRAATEVYLRRVYRAHDLLSLEIKEETDAVTAAWSFANREAKDQVRTGTLRILPQLLPGQLDQDLLSIVQQMQRGPQGKNNVLHLGFLADSDPRDEQLAAAFANSLRKLKPSLQSLDVRMANFLVVRGPRDDVESRRKVSYFNHYSELDFAEDPVSRDMRPTMPQLLELFRVAVNHDLQRLPTVGRNAFMFLGKDKSSGSGPDAQSVLFLRAISLSEESVRVLGAERIIAMALDELERAVLDPRVGDTTSARLFVHILPEIESLVLDECLKNFQKIMDGLIAKFATRLLKLRVDEIEVKLRVREAADQAFLPVRLIASSSTGGWLTREAYKEVVDPITGQTKQFCRLASFGSAQPFDVSNGQLCVLDPYPTSNVLQRKRSIARRVGSTYAPDFLGLMEVALVSVWQKWMEALGHRNAEALPASPLFQFEELVLDGKGEIVKTRRFPGSNRIAMLAYETVLKTPSYPEGREVVFIMNDVTVQSGSFGVQEDEFFYQVSKYARERGIPRIFIACNSGARIGLVEEVKPRFQVAWKDDAKPALGFEYLYLSPADLQSLPPNSVQTTTVTASSGEVRHRIDAIIGTQQGIGVENLRGSGLIAGETSRAYDETFTLSYVTGRSVGIGAYLNRLGQRIIQMQHGPMILTGFGALNKLLGREVYTSQDQLGGPQIMAPNGVTHQVVGNDQEGMQAVLDWLEFVPRRFSDAFSPPLTFTQQLDPVDRPIDFVPTKTPYDPRHMLAGFTASDGSFVSGFFDKDSFKESLGGWGKTVVVGRARLGGVPCGAIAVETRTVEQRIPADPGNPDSREALLPQAGQVWYPDSAFKTAQAIEDFNRGENLPLIIFANWRGFSGGTRDMFSEILKFGAMIVDALRNYRHPVMVYIPPAAELRGGAWVVIDPTINPNKMQMFADPDSRGGILEPPGICEVKFRGQEQVQAMHRLDAQLIQLDEELALAQDNVEKERLTKEIKAREKLLAPLFLQIAHEFADLHDRAGRMKAKGCIDEVVAWPQARQFFYWRIRSRQMEEKVLDSWQQAGMSRSSAEEKMKVEIPADVTTDRRKFEWLVKEEQRLLAL